MILHLRVAPGFGIAVEARSRPELSSLPVIMGGPPQSRGSVREANFPAQSRGVQPGSTTLAQAHQYCPDGLFLAPDDALYAAVWKQLCAILRRFTPLVQPLTLGQAALDLTGCPGADDPSRLAGEIARAVRSGTGITPCLGVATNRLVAELASQDLGITIVPPGRERTFLADLPLTALQLETGAPVSGSGSPAGIDARLALTFQVLGLRTIGQFAALPRSAVRQRFGAPGEQLHNWSRGIDSRPVVPPPEEPAVHARAECDEGTPEDAIATLHRLAGECAAELQRRNLAGSLVALTLTWSAASVTSFPSSIAPSSVIPSPVALPLRGHPAHGGSRATAAAEHCASHRTLSLSERNAALRGGPGHRGPGLPDPAAEQTFPIAYRIHSMLPQPGNPKGIPEYKPVTVPATYTETPANLPAADPPSIGIDTVALPPTTLTTLVRTPITNLPPLFERARDLLLRHWPYDPPRILHAIELAVSSFEQPIQLAFAELNRLDGIGLLRGMDPARRRAFEQAEEALATRYGDTSFRRLAHLDPANILTERRFRWEEGIRCQVSGIRASPRSRT